MRFEIRSEQTVLADLISKLEALLALHPDRAALARMIHDLNKEIGITLGRPLPTLAVATVRVRGALRSSLPARAKRIEHIAPSRFP
jgi:hypothetical protein